jgi:hypothetical protein
MEEKHGNRKIKKKIKTSLLIIVITLVVIFIFKLRGSSTGVVIPSKPSSTVTTPSFNFTPVSVAGKYASFSYPASMTTFNVGPPSGSELEAYGYLYKDIETWFLAVTVLQLHSNSLSQDSGYEYRAINPDHYKQSSATFGENHYVIMTDTTASGFSEVAFSLNGDMSGDISLYGNDTFGTQNLVKTFDMVLTSWQWK